MNVDYASPTVEPVDVAVRGLATADGRVEVAVVHRDGWRVMQVTGDRDELVDAFTDMLRVAAAGRRLVGLVSAELLALYEDPSVSRRQQDAITVVRGMLDDSDTS